MALVGRLFYWVVGEHHGRPFRLGSFSSEEEAYAYGYDKLPCSFDVVSTNTKDPNRAVRELRKRKLDQTGDLDGALTRGRRKPPEEYQGGRW